MLIATNRGAGQNVGFPDVCLTPAGPAPVPIPYPNMGMHVLAAPFSPNVLWTFMSALNLLSKITMTIGMNAGVAHPLYMMMGGFTLGSFIVFVNNLPAIHLCCITYGNNYNNPIGGVLAPSVTVVFITLRGVGAREIGRLTPGDVSLLESTLRDEAALPAVAAERIDGARVCLRIRAFATHTPTRVWNALRAVGAFDELVIDLRGNPGGDGEAALALAGDFVAPGTVLAIRRDDRRYDKEIVARAPGPYEWPLTLLVDESTASAAEIFAGALQHAGRARLVGTRTFGKGTAQRLVPSERGALYATVAEFLLPNGDRIEGVGLEPDIAVGPRH
jgi:carboxyl-terminal processing protease